LQRLSSRIEVLELHTEVPALLRYAERLRETFSATVTQARELLTPVTVSFSALSEWPADPSAFVLMVASNKGEATSGGAVAPNLGAQFRVKLGEVLRKVGSLQQHWQDRAEGLNGAVETLRQGTRALLGKIAEPESTGPAGASSFCDHLRGLAGTLEEMQRGLELARGQVTEVREDTASVIRALGTLVNCDFVLLYPEGADDSEGQQYAAKLAGTCLDARRALGEHLAGLTSGRTSDDLRRQIEQLEQGLRDLAGPAAVLDAKFDAEIRAIRGEQQALKSEQQALTRRLDTVLEQGLAALREDMRRQAEAASQRQELLLAELARMQRKYEQHDAYSRLRNNLRRMYGLVYALCGVTTAEGHVGRWPASSHSVQDERTFGDIPFPFPSVSFSSLSDGLVGQARSALSMLSQPQHYPQGYSAQAESQLKACSDYVERFKKWHRDCEASLQTVQEHAALVVRDLDIVAGGASGPSGARAARAPASTGERRERERVSTQVAATARASRPPVASGTSAAAATVADADSIFVVQLGSFTELDPATFCGSVRAILVRVREVDEKIQHLSQPITEMLRQWELARENLSSKEDPQTRLRKFGSQGAALEVSWKGLGDEVKTIWTGTPPLQELFVKILRAPDPVF
jgi:hypothetical protein